MRFEDGKTADPVRTAFALIRAVDEMATPMRRRLGRTVERTRTQAAFVRAAAGMLADVIAQPFGRQEALRTVWTRVAAHLLVRSHVLGQRVVLIELAVANGASVDATAMVAVHVIAEHRWCAESGRTQFATIGPATSERKSI